MTGTICKVILNWLFLISFIACNDRVSHSLYRGRSSHSENPRLFNIGAVVDSAESTAQFLQAIEDVNYEPNILPPGLSLYPTSITLNPNPVRTVQSVCEKLIKSQVYAVVVSDNDASESLAVSQTLNFYNVPVIGLSNRDSSMSDKHMHGVYMRTVPPYSHQVDVWIAMLKNLEYRHVVFIHSANYDGRTTFLRFQGLADRENIIISSIIEYEPGITDIVSELEEADEEIQCRVYLLYTDALDAQSIFLEVARLNMTAPGYVWIISEQALKATNVPDGVLALRLFNATNGIGHIRDSVYIVGMAVRDMFLNENITKPPDHCGDLGKNYWETGGKFFNYLRKQFLLFGKTGRVAFDGKGDRIDSDYEIINMVHGRPVTVGQFAFSQVKMRMQLWLNAHSIIWPGYQSTKPLGYVIPTHLRVVTLAEKPFIWAQRVHEGEQCDLGSFPCPKFHKNLNKDVPYCCQGYCVDFLTELSRRLNFTYSLYQVSDDVYGSFEHVNGTEYPKVWTGLVGDLVYKKADMIVAPLTINPERSLYIEFSKPFKYQGITILEKKQPRRATLASFMEPFENSLWVLVSVAVHFVALALYLLDRFSPFGRYRLPNSEITEEDALNLSSAIWFAWGVLLNSGIGEGTPRSFSGRVLGMVWAGFAMIMVASYTANLAALLVLDRPKTSLIGINDPRLRNPGEDFKYATVKGSAVETYFKSQIELQTMYSHMEGRNYPSVEAGVEALKRDEIQAFFYDSARMEYEAAHDCDLITAAEQFGRSGYGIGLQKKSFWLEKINQAILSMHESGNMTDLDKAWISAEDEDGVCVDRYEKFPTTLGLSNMAGVFILVGAGIIGGIGLIVIEVIYKKQQTKTQRQLESARAAAEKWKEFVQLHFGLALPTNPEKADFIARLQNVQRRQYRSHIHKIRQQQLKQQLQQQEQEQQHYQQAQGYYKKHTKELNYPEQQPQYQQERHYKELNTQMQTQYVDSVTPYTVEKGINEIRKDEDPKEETVLYNDYETTPSYHYDASQQQQPQQQLFKNELQQKLKEKQGKEHKRKPKEHDAGVTHRKKKPPSTNSSAKGMECQHVDSYSSLPTNQTPIIKPPHAIMYQTRSHDFNYGYGYSS